jgi:glycosyltransferase involved in cell wall biosynthesis
MSFEPLVSIIINNKNYDKYISEAINSALNQTYQNIEVIVVDDGSTDNSQTIINSYKEKVIAIFKENGGQASAFNEGYKVAKGEIVCFLDSDDIFDKYKIAEIVKIYEENPEVDWCFHQVVFLDQKSGNHIGKSNEHGTKKCDFRSQIRGGKLPYFTCPSTSGLTFSRSFLDQALPMPVGKDVIISDLYLKILSMGISKGFFLDKDLALIRVHEKNRYTQRTDVQLLKAKIHLFTSNALLNMWPDLREITINLFSYALVELLLYHGLNEKYVKKVIKEYFKSIQIGDKLRVISKFIIGVFARLGIYNVRKLISLLRCTFIVIL